MKARVPLFTMFIYSKDKLLSAVLNTIFTNYEITNVESDRYWIIITLYNGKDTVTVKGWNANNWYAFLGSGTIYINNKSYYEWVDSRPTRKTMNMILEKCSDYMNRKFKGII